MDADPTLSEAARQDLERIYEEVDREIAASGARCWMRGHCCDFERADHVLYASNVEIAYVREKRQGPFESESPLCPFWQQGVCDERERRPLGCRTYFCDTSARDELEAIYERKHQAIRLLAEHHGLDYRYEPFVHSLRRPSDAG